MKYTATGIVFKRLSLAAIKGCYGYENHLFGFGFITT